MKKFVVSLVVLALALSGVQALAVYGDVTVQSVKAYLDPEMTQYIGTIPQYTAVVVYDADSDIASLNVNGVNCYVRPTALTNSRFDYYYAGYSVLLAGSVVYQRPTTGSRAVLNGHNRPVLVVGVKGDWVLVRSDFGGFYGFTLRSNLSGFTAAG